MKLQYLRAFIVLLAGLITLIMNIKTGKDVTVSLVIVLIVILVFYIIATLIVEILQRALEKKENTENIEQAEETEEEVDIPEEIEPVPFDEDE